jgi:hypothetical protein
MSWAGWQARLAHLLGPDIECLCATCLKAEDELLKQVRRLGQQQQGTLSHAAPLSPTPPPPQRPTDD